MKFKINLLLKKYKKNQILRLKLKRMMRVRLASEINLNLKKIE